MGLGVSELLLILAIVAMIFGTKKLRNIGGDLGGAIRSFRQSISEDDRDHEMPTQSKPAVADKSMATDTSERSF